MGREDELLAIKLLTDIRGRLEWLDDDEIELLEPETSMVLDSRPRVSVLKLGREMTVPLPSPPPLPAKRAPDRLGYMGSLITLSGNEEVEPAPWPHPFDFSSPLPVTLAPLEVLVSPGCAESTFALTLLLALPPMGPLEVLQRLEPLERKLPKVMEPWVLIKGVARCC